MAGKGGGREAGEAGELRPAESARIPCLPKTLVGRMIVEDVRNRFSIDKNPQRATPAPSPHLIFRAPSGFTSVLFCRVVCSLPLVRAHLA